MNIVSIKRLPLRGDDDNYALTVDVNGEQIEHKFSVSACATKVHGHRSSCAYSLAKAFVEIKQEHGLKGCGLSGSEIEALQPAYQSMVQN